MPKDFFVGNLCVSESDVVGKRTGKQENILQNDGKIFSQRFQIPIAHVNSVQQNSSALHVVKAH
jgi:hypothetical protein